MLLSAIALAALSMLPKYAIVRLAGSDVQIVVQDIDGSEHVVNSRRLLLRVPGNDVWIIWHNESLLKSCAVSYDNKSRRFSFFDVQETIKGKEGVSEGWQSKGNLTTIEFDGTVVESHAVVLPWEGASTYIGHDDRGLGVLIQEQDAKGRVFARHGWAESKLNALPHSWRALNSLLERLLARGTPLAGATEPSTSLSIPENPDWVDLDFPMAWAKLPSLLNFACDGDAWATYNWIEIDASWPQGRVRRAFPADRRLVHVRLGTYPKVLGAVQGFEVQDAYKPFQVGTTEPFVSSTVYEYDLVSGALSPVSTGLYVIPLH